MGLIFLNNFADVALVEVREENWPSAMFITISPSPSTMVTQVRFIEGIGNKGKVKKVTLPYGRLRQIEQYRYCLRVVKSCYRYSYHTRIFGTWELNKAGNVHFHLLMTDKNIKTETDLHMFRKDVLNCEMVMDNLRGHSKDYMNNIVYVNDTIEERLKYMKKDMETNLSIFPYFFINCADEEIAAPSDWWSAPVPSTGLRAGGVV